MRSGVLETRDARFFQLGENAFGSCKVRDGHVQMRRVAEAHDLFRAQL